MIASAQKPQELTGRRVLFYLIAFFVVVFGVEAAFIAVAVSTHTGMVSNQPYRKGLNYDERIEFARRQENLGWRETLVASTAEKTIKITLVDQYGKPVRGLFLKGSIGRAVTDAQDQTLDFRSNGDGVYIAAMPDKLSGAYIADFNAAKGAPDSEIIWRMRKRLWLKP